MGYFFECIFHKYFDFSGRARRKEYWWYTIIHALIAVIISVIAASQRNAMFMEALKNHQSVSNIPAIMPCDIVLYVWCIFTLCPTLAVLTRRLHDINKGVGTLLVYIIHGVLLEAALFTPGSIVKKYFGTTFFGILGYIVVCLLIIGAFLLILLCRKGTAGRNDYGIDPLEKYIMPENNEE